MWLGKKLWTSIETRVGETPFRKKNVRVNAFRIKNQKRRNILPHYFTMNAKMSVPIRHVKQTYQRIDKQTNIPTENTQVQCYYYLMKTIERYEYYSNVNISVIQGFKVIATIG